MNKELREELAEIIFKGYTNELMNDATMLSVELDELATLVVVNNGGSKDDTKYITSVVIDKFYDIGFEIADDPFSMGELDLDSTFTTFRKKV